MIVVYFQGHINIGKVEMRQFQGSLAQGSNFVQLLRTWTRSSCAKCFWMTSAYIEGRRRMSKNILLDSIVVLLLTLHNSLYWVLQSHKFVTLVLMYFLPGPLFRSKVTESVEKKSWFVLLNESPPGVYTSCFIWVLKACCVFVTLHT